jgi:hypothetical protein
VIACGHEHIALVAATIWPGLLFLIDVIPSHETFRCVFMLIDPGACEACFRPWEPVSACRPIVRENGWTSHFQWHCRLLENEAGKQIIFPPTFSVLTLTHILLDRLRL